MFYFLSKTLDLLISPLCWVLVLIAAGFFRRFEAHRKKFLASSIAILWIFGLEPVANGMWRLLESDAGPPPPPEARWEAVVLLGGVVDPAADPLVVAANGASYNDNVERLLRTFELLRSDRAKVAILSGSMGDRDPDSEAHRLGRQLEAWGIARERIVIEPRAMNTRENAVFSAEILKARGIERFVIVTSAFHMERSRECFSAVGLHPDTFPVDVRTHPFAVTFASFAPRASAFEVSSAALREGFGRWVYRARGYAKR